MNIRNNNTNNDKLVSVIHPICCGVDVHKDVLSATLVKNDSQGKEECVVQEFGTYTEDLYKFRDWLLLNNCPIIAIESTGVYWRPVHNIVEGHMEVILVNARHVKNVPGRKTDVQDSKWLAGLLRHGLLSGSFIPEKEVRQLRELGRLRKKYTETSGDFKRRVHRFFQTANIKIDSVVSDLFCVTGRNLIKLFCKKGANLSLEEVQQAAKGSLREKVDELYKSVQGFFEQHHQFELKMLMRTIDQLEKEVERLTDRMHKLTKHHKDLIERLDEVPGINEFSAQNVLAEVGTTLNEFDNTEAFASWAGVCPGNNQSAGKRKSGKNAVTAHPFKSILVEIAWAAVKKKDSFYRAKYYQLKSRKGARKAIIAIAHKIAKVLFRIIKFGEAFKDLGENFLVEQNKSKRVKRLKKQAKQLGFVLIPVAS